eukprot:scaffold19881_cov102-Isochrysis_galbana.AAC.2
MPGSRCSLQNRPRASPGALNDGLTLHSLASHRLLLTFSMSGSRCSLQNRPRVSPGALKVG